MFYEGCIDRGYKEVVINLDSKVDEFVCFVQGVNNLVCGVNGVSVQKKGYIVDFFFCDGYERYV